MTRTNKPPNDPAFLANLEHWCSLDMLPPDLLDEPRRQLQAWRDGALSTADAARLADRFGRLIRFGTAGLRAEMGPGINRMNLWTVALAALGVAGWLQNGTAEATDRPNRVVIAFDGRHRSAEFARLTAELLAAEGLTAVLFESPQPTPQLVYSIRVLDAQAGIVLTASHNAAAYNGFKVYNAAGIQTGAEEACAIAAGMAQIDPTDHLQRLLPRLQMPLDEHPQIQTAPADLIHQYRQYLCDLYPIQGSENELTVVYTPVHGVGGASARAVFAAVGVNNLIVVPEQFEPHPDFITTPSPNPENPEVLSAAAGLALRHKADLVLATDPDADRAAVMLPDGKGGYRQLTGNEVGALLTAIMIRRYQAAPQENPASPPPVLVKTVVTDRFGAAVAAAAGCEVIEELTGFKNICGVIPDLLRDGKTFLLGYEESIGYAFGDRVRDKDGLAALRILIGEAARLRKEGRTLRDELHQLFEQHGYFISRPFSLSYPGTEGADIIRDIIAAFRTHFPRQAGRARLIRYRDYAKRLEYTPAKDKNGSWTAEPFPEAYLGGKTDNLLSFDFDNGSHYALRPSGTEPKLKFYIYATAPDLETAKDRCEILYTTVSMLADHTAGLV